jgi:hypothetical protein
VVWLNLAVVNTAMSIRVRYKAGSFLISRRTIRLRIPFLCANASGTDHSVSSVVSHEARNLNNAAVEAPKLTNY